MQPGSVVVDLAAEAGGNVQTTKPGEIAQIHGVTHIGLTDLPSRMPSQSSNLYANNISGFLLSLGKFQYKNELIQIKTMLFSIHSIYLGSSEHFNINLSDEVTRGSIILHKGEMMWPPPPPAKSAVAPPPPKVVKEAPPPPDPFTVTLKDSLMYTSGTILLFLYNTQIFL